MEEDTERGGERVERQEKITAKLVKNIERDAGISERVVMVLTRREKKSPNVEKVSTSDEEILAKGGNGITEVEKTSTYWENKNKHKKAAPTSIKAAFLYRIRMNFSA
ncbi:hypothetical protein NT017_04390 [Prolixibacter sp. NT017]|nr:hypothetical protein NT017_04390 [Prolixibacter sp. NT017]